MSDGTGVETPSTPTREQRGISRRAALRAGVATGVGVAAWSGATITSLGGTPAYAQAGCTNVIKLDLTGGCRNTDKRSEAQCPGGAFAFHPLQAPPAGFTLKNNPPADTCCDDVTGPTQTQLCWTIANLKCSVTFEIWEGGKSDCEAGTGNLIIHNVASGTGNAAGGCSDVPLNCDEFTRPVPPGVPLPGGDSFWKVFAQCASSDAPAGCT